MIPIRRGPEPDELREERWWRLARLKLVLDESADPAKTLAGETITGYDTGDVRTLLRDAQHHKCAYCERDHEETAQPIEHLRPKKGSERERAGTKPGDPLHYWWLAWTWENLFFSCTSCNSTACKANLFPLAPGSAPLALESTAVHEEHALLLDPAREQPMDHIQFQQRADGRWAPVPRDGSARGDETIKTLCLDRPDLLDLYDLHVSEEVERHLVHIENAIARGEPHTIQQVWERRVPALLGNPRQGWVTKPFAALTWDVVDQRFPAAERRRWGIPLPRPGKSLAPDPPSNELRPDLTARFEPATVWLIRAIGRPAGGYKAHLQRALLAILRDPGGGPMTAPALKTIIDDPFTYSLDTITETLEQSQHASLDPTGIWTLINPAPSA